MSDDRWSTEPLGEVIRELGLSTWPAGDRLVGEAEIVPEMWVPGTDTVRLSVLATWGDLLTGIHAGTVFAPRVGLTLDLDVHLLSRPSGTAAVHGEAYTLKRGRTIVVERAELTLEGAGAPFAVCTATFMASPDPAHLLPPEAASGRRQPGRLTTPLAQRVGARRLDTGVAEVPLRPGNLNATHAIQGGIIALCAEEAALSSAPGHILRSMSMRFMRAFRDGPARATATARDGLVLFQLADPAGGKLGVTGTAQLRPA